MSKPLTFTTVRTTWEIFQHRIASGDAVGRAILATADHLGLKGINAVRSHLAMAAALGMPLPAGAPKPSADPARVHACFAPDLAYQAWLRVRETIGAPKPRIRVKAASAPAAAAEPLASCNAPPAPALDDLEERKQADERQQLRQRIKALEARAISAEAWQEQFRSLDSDRVTPPAWTPRGGARAANELVPILFTSDFQVGEVIRPEEIDGINKYDQDVFGERYQAMIDKTLMLARENTGADSFPYAIYLRGGDAISGEIHAELAETNDLSSVPALALLRRYEREGIRRLRDAFGRVRVISIPGNHGRTTFKPHAKGYTERSYEMLLAWWLESSFEDDPRVSFYTPPSGDALFEVYGWNWLLSHGDRMGSRGGQGFIGPSATIARGHQKLYQNWTATGRPVHNILTGHLHTSLKLERGYANGSLAGYSEYARDLRALPDAAKQWLFFAHAEKMVSHAFELILSPRPRRDAAMPGAFA